MGKAPLGATAEVDEAQSSSVSIAFRSVSRKQSLPVQYLYICIYLDGRGSLSQKKVTNLELRKLRIALTVLSSIPELDRFTGLES